LNDPEKRSTKSTPVASGAFGYNAGEIPTPAPRKEGTITIIK